MEMKKFKDIELSRLGMGAMRLPVKKVGDKTVIDRAEAQKIIDYGMANGINYYDTAYVYHNGESEAFLGEAMAKYPRDSYYIATKFLINANPDYKAVFEEQLNRLKTEYVDFYLIHALSDDNYKKYLDCGCIDYLLEQKRMGRIKHLGFSSHASPETLKKFATHHEWDFVQIQLNYFDWNYSTTKAEYEVLESLNIPIMVMEPVRGGRLASLCNESEKMLASMHEDWSIVSWAFRWIKTLPQVQVVLSGMSNLEQISDNIQTFSNHSALNEEETAMLMKACDTFKSRVQVPCTACRYCCDECPAQINIPEVLTVYNKYKTDGPWALREMEGIDSNGTAKDCVACGACNGHCPQGIDVCKIMQELAVL